ncbi:hypothetical protein GUITHDRAFT_155141, partial [Guillardia theta CCMP2712]
MFELLHIKNKNNTGSLPQFSTEAGVPHFAWKLALAAGPVANKDNITKIEPIRFGGQNTVEMADAINGQGNFSS